jgi:hypothetical protein
MVRNKKNQKESNLFWRIAISLVGAALILLAVSRLLLFFYGETAPARITTDRRGGANDGASVNQRYEWSVDYTFKDQSGGTHSGHTTRRGSDLSSGVTDDTVYYFTVAPFISALESDADPGLGQLILAVLGVFLLVVMNRKRKKRVRPLKKDVRPEHLTDYDDSVEDQYHKKQ